MAYLGIDELKTQPEQKYYWLVLTNRANEQMLSERVINSHPFEFMKSYRKVSECWVVLNWREISKEEYDLFNA